MRRDEWARREEWEEFVPPPQEMFEILVPKLSVVALV